jgi:signal transduction histidine kinase
VLGSDLFLPAPGSLMYSVAFGVFIVFGALVAVRMRSYGGLYGLLIIFADTILFLILLNHGAERAPWLPSLLFLFIMSEGVAFYGPREVALVAALCLCFSPVGIGRRTHLPKTILVGGALACAFVVTRRKLMARVNELDQELVLARKQGDEASTLERQRIASDFHDGPLQNFISFQMRLEIVRKLLERDRTAGLHELAQLQNVATSQVRELRAFIRSMRPMELDGQNLAASARWIAENFQKESGIPVTFVGGDSPISVPPEICAEVLQMLREALHNVQKHAGATRVAVGMERNSKTLEISVDDNGRGFQFSGNYSLEELELLRLGPLSLKRRARALNADLLLDSRPGRGAGLKMSIPI